jgi:uncharacterized protein HemX
VPWRMKTIRQVGPEAPVTHREIRKVVFEMLAACAITLATSVGAGGLAFHLGQQRTCENEWTRYKAREGVRAHFRNELMRVLVVSDADEQIRSALVAAEQQQLDADLPSYPVPDCRDPNPATS